MVTGARAAVAVERLRTGVPGIDAMLRGGIPRGFLVAVTGEPGTGKTIFCLHFAWEGVKEGDRVVYVTTEESRESILSQAEQFGMDLRGAVEEGRAVVIDALLGRASDQWSLRSLNPEDLVEIVLKAKKTLGYGRGRLVIDSMSAFWLDKPAMARKYSYYVKKVLSRWDFTVLAVSQYAVTTSEAFGWGIEHVADGIIRFRRFVRGGLLRRYVMVEKMRQTAHDLRMYEVTVEDGKGLVVLRPTEMRAEDVALPSKVTERIVRAREKKEEAL